MYSDLETEKDREREKWARGRMGDQIMRKETRTFLIDTD